MKNERLHSTLLALVGGYVLFLAYDIYNKYKSGAKEMSDTLYIIIIVFFSLAGIAVLYYSWTVYKKYLHEEKNNEENGQKRREESKSETDENSGT